MMKTLPMRSSLFVTLLLAAAALAGYALFF